MELKEHDIVIVKKDGQHVKKGEKGTIVHIYSSGDFEVEFSEDENKVVLLLKEEVKLYNPKKEENGK